MNEGWWTWCFDGWSKQSMKCTQNTVSFSTKLLYHNIGFSNFLFFFIPLQPALVDVIEKDQGTASFVDKLPQTAKRIIGIGGSMIAGTLYGVNFIPVLYIMAHTEGASQDGEAIDVTAWKFEKNIWTKFKNSIHIYLRSHLLNECWPCLVDIKKFLAILKIFIGHLLHTNTPTYGKNSGLQRCEDASKKGTNLVRFFSSQVWTTSSLILLASI